MRVALSCVVALCALAMGAATAMVAAPARAQTGPVIVVPGRPDVPVMINGVIANGAVVYGDWGLARPGHGQIIIEGPIAYGGSFGPPGYFPSAGRAPRVGRLEVEPPPRRRPSTDFYRDWSVESDSRRPVTEYPPFDPPPVILAPRGRRR